MAEYRERCRVSDEALNALFASAWPGHVDRSFATVLDRSLGWVCAFEDDALVGFANVATDGGAHAFLLDVTVDGRMQRRGIGRELVAAAVAMVQRSDAEWLHVDYEVRLERFYSGAGFAPTAAGLLRVTR
jgi:ribosomal protein S18 acetylase RimI-like enzyme